MKRIIYALVAIVVLGCFSGATSDKAQLVIEIEGMSCNVSCSPFIQKKLNATEGVESAVVDFDTKLATVVINEGTVSQEEIVEKIQKLAGGQYKVKSCKATVLTNTEAPKASLESTSDFDISQPEVSTAEFKLPNFFKILNMLLN
tara:strand:- start:374 stop:808 length:435 start_codon:yes stop_codon:yes gene_type:complete